KTAAREAKKAAVLARRPSGSSGLPSRTRAGYRRTYCRRASRRSNHSFQGRHSGSLRCGETRERGYGPCLAFTRQRAQTFERISRSRRASKKRFVTMEKERVMSEPAPATKTLKRGD